MALAFIHSPEVLSLQNPQHKDADTARLQVMPGSFQQRGYLLDNIMHVVDLWTRPHCERPSFTSVTSVRSFDIDTATELTGWSIRGSSHFPGYIQARIYPVDGVEHINNSWLRVPEGLSDRGLFTEPGAMPRYMSPQELTPDFLASINRTEEQVGHLALVG